MNINKKYINKKTPPQSRGGVTAMKLTPAASYSPTQSPT